MRGALVRLGHSLAAVKILDRDYKIEHSQEHRAKFRGDRPTELGDYARGKKEKKTTAKQKSFRKLSFSGGLIRYNAQQDNGA